MHKIIRQLDFHGLKSLIYIIIIIIIIIIGSTALCGPWPSSKAPSLFQALPIPHS
jgi:hypothetical protein